MKKEAKMISLVFFIAVSICGKNSEASLVEYKFISIVEYVRVGSLAANFWEIGDQIITTVRVDNSSLKISYWDDGPNGIGEFGGGDDTYQRGETFSSDWLNFASDTTKIKLDPVFKEFLKEYISVTPGVLDDNTYTDWSYSHIYSVPERNYETFSTPAQDYYYFLKDGVELEYGINYSNFFNKPDYYYYGTINIISPIGSGDLRDAVGMEVVSVSITPVPEPTTILLFGTGLAGLAAVGRRRRK